MALTFRVLLTLVPLLSVATAFSGLPTFNLAQTAVGSIVAGLCLVAWAVLPPARGDAAPWRGFAAGAWLLALLWAVARHLLGELDASGYDQLALFVLATPLILAGAMPRSGVPAREAVADGVALAAVANAVVALSQRLGHDLLPRIPTATVHAAPTGFFDDPGQAATWSVIALPLLCGAAMGAGPNRRWFVALAAGAAAVSLGLTQTFGSWWVLGASSVAVACLLAFSQGGRSWSRAAAFVVPMAVAASFSLAPPAQSPAADPLQSMRHPRTQIEAGQLGGWSDPAAASLLDAATWDLAKASQPLGVGLGGVSRHVLEHVDHDAPWTAAQTLGLRPVIRAPSAALQHAAELGMIGAALVLAMLLLALRATARPRALTERPEWLGAPALLAALVAYAAGPGLWTAPGVSVLACAVAFSLDGGPVAPAPAPLRRFGPVLAAAALSALVFWPQAETLRWGYHQGRANVWVWHSGYSKAVGEYVSASQVQSRFETWFNLGLLQVSMSTEGVRKGAASMQKAVELDDSSARARYVLAEAYARIARSDQAETDRSLDDTAALLETALRLDPNLVSAAMLLSDIYFVAGKFDDAKAAASRMLGRPIPETAKVEPNLRLARLAEDTTDDPATAMKFYQAARPWVRSAREAEWIDRKLARVKRWMESGVKPPEDDGHGHGDEEPDGAVGEPHGADDHAGHGHGHGHEGAGSGAQSGDGHDHGEGSGH